MLSPGKQNKTEKRKPTDCSPSLHGPRTLGSRKRAALSFYFSVVQLWVCVSVSEHCLILGYLHDVLLCTFTLETIDREGFTNYSMNHYSGYTTEAVDRWVIEKETLYHHFLFSWQKCRLYEASRLG